MAAPGLPSPGPDPALLTPGPDPGPDAAPDRSPDAGLASRRERARRSPQPVRNPERGAGTVLALGLGLVLVLAMSAVVLLGQAAVLASKAAAAADLAALAAADAARGIAAGEPCAVAADVARRNGARLLACAVDAGDTVQVRTELDARAAFGPASGLARAGPPPPKADRQRAG